MGVRRMNRLVPSTIAAFSLALGACSQGTGTDGSESDFASRVGAGNAPAAPAAAASPGATSAVAGPPPANADVFALQQLGDIGAVDLGPRDGGCTFSVNGIETLIAAGADDRSLPGKAVVRIGGKLIALDTPPGGIGAIRAGTSYAGEGFSVRVQPTAPAKATMTITNARGESRQTAGDWTCA